jgi:hypothetical protein
MQRVGQQGYDILILRFNHIHNSPLHRRKAHSRNNSDSMIWRMRIERLQRSDSIGVMFPIRAARAGARTRTVRRSRSPRNPPRTIVVRMRMPKQVRSRERADAKQHSKQQAPLEFGLLHDLAAVHHAMNLHLYGG